MSRIDIPTVQCDRCKTTTADLNEMGRFQNLRGVYDGYQSTKANWDLCPACWSLFVEFVGSA